MLRGVFALPLLAGATWRERGLGALGALIGISLSGYLATLTVGDPKAALLLAAPIGASAVLVFAIPSSPLGQPWPVIGGNILSVLAGAISVQFLGVNALAAGVAVSTAILLMTLCRCLHPPGGGSALLPLVGGEAVFSHGYSYALIPVGLNAALLVVAGLLYHRMVGNSYPHKAVAPPAKSKVVSEDIDAALEEMGASFDISREDLEALLGIAERHAAERRRRERRLSVMTRKAGDVFTKLKRRKLRRGDLVDR